MSWYTGEIVAFDLETTGTDPETDRIVTAAVTRIDVPARSVDPQTWLADPGVEIPQAATEVHGITTAYARTHGEAIGRVVVDVHAQLRSAWQQHVPVVVFNAPYDLTLLDRELRRHTGDGLGELGPVVDPLVIDRAVDRYRKGSRRLAALCRHYGLDLTDEAAHTSDADALAAARLAWCLGQRFPELAVPLAELQTLQAGWHHQWAAGFEHYLRARKASEGASHEELAAISIDRHWPLRPWGKETVR